MDQRDFRVLIFKNDFCVTAVNPKVFFSVVLLQHLGSSRFFFPPSVLLYSSQVDQGPHRLLPFSCTEIEMLE